MYMTPMILKQTVRNQNLGNAFLDAANKKLMSRSFDTL